MTRSTMRGLLHRAATTALLTLLPSVAWAQVSPTGTPTGQTTTQTGAAISTDLLVYRNRGSGENFEEVKHGTLVYASKKYDCQDGSRFQFKTTYSTPIPVVEAWVGVDVDCSQKANRTVTSVASNETACEFLGSKTSVRELNLEVEGERVFDREQTKEDTSWDCEDSTGGAPKYTVYILALSSATQDTVAVDPIAGNLKAVLKASFSPYLKVPEAPKNPRPLNGESRIGIEFDAAGDAQSLWQYKAWFDFGAPSGALECGTGYLDDVNKVPSTGDADIFESKQSTERKAYTSASALADDQVVRAVAVAVDPAGNESLLSEGVCAKKVQTTGFLDACGDDPACKDSLDSCSLSPGRNAGMFGLSMFVLALAALLQRRRSR